MNRKILSEQLSVSGQLSVADIENLSKNNINSIICNRPEGESDDQTSFREIEVAAKKWGISTAYLPVISGRVKDSDVEGFAAACAQLPKPIHAYCRSGMRCTTLWALSAVQSGEDRAEVLAMAKRVGYDLSGLGARLSGGVAALNKSQAKKTTWDVLIVGAGAGGIAVASSILARAEDGLSIAVIDPADTHYYQPGWTLVGAGVFTADFTKKVLSSLVPVGVSLIKAAVAEFMPERNCVRLESNEEIAYKRLVVTPGIKLDWDAVEGLSETLGKHGVTSNYRFDLAPYTWELVQQLKSGKALFNQPPMPIKCAGAPQKAMYLSADYWYKNKLINEIDIEFYNAEGALFGVKDYVPALMSYVDKYQVDLKFSHNLTQIDGPAKTAWFERADAEGNKEIVSAEFDMIHVCPPQSAPDFIRRSALADAAGWVDVDQNTLRHKSFDNIWSLGDAMNAPNAKTAAAARKQAPVVANNILADISQEGDLAYYDGYGACPLTVERGKVVLAEFGYEGELLPSFPRFLLDGTRPSRAAWFLKEKLLPPIYWKVMLKGREWMAKPEINKVRPELNKE